MTEALITIRIIEIGGGGFVIAELGTDDYDPLQAVSTIDEAAGAIQRRVREWHSEMKTLRNRHDEDDGKVIAPARWRPWRAIE